MAEHCPCTGWCITYQVERGERHHRDCKQWNKQHLAAEVFQTRTELIVTGDPGADENHNCDALGCSSVSHVLFRFPLPHGVLVGDGTGQALSPLPESAYPRGSKPLTEQGVKHEDTVLLDFIASEYLDVSAFAMPTGAGDADVGWKLHQEHMGAKGRVEVACHYRDDLRAAIREAMQALGHTLPDGVSACASEPSCAQSPMKGPK